MVFCMCWAGPTAWCDYCDMFEADCKRPSNLHVWMSDVRTACVTLICKDLLAAINCQFLLVKHL